MAIILRLQNLPWSANSMDIRRYFQGLSIPEGGVHIVGGEKGDAFIAFTTDEDARQAMERDGGKVKEIKIKLMLSSRLEMQKVIEQARTQCVPGQVNLVAKTKEQERSRSPERGRKSSPDRKRDRSPRDRDRDKNSRAKSSSSRKDRSRSRSPSRRNRDRDRDRDRDTDRRSKRSDDRRKSDDVPKSREDPSRHDNNSDSRSSAPQSLNNDISEFGRQNPLRNPANDPAAFSAAFNQQQQQGVNPWLDGKIPIWEGGKQDMMGINKPEAFRSGVQQDFMARDPFGIPVRREDEGERGRSGLPPAFESGLAPRRQVDSFAEGGIGFPKQPDDSINKFRSFVDSDQRIVSPMMGEQGFPLNPTRGFGFCMEVRGLPVSVSYKDVRDLFRGIFIPNDGLKLINDVNGQRSGTALMRLSNQRDVNEALKKNKQFVGDNYIDVFRCSDSVFDLAVDSYLPPAMKKGLHVPPRPDDLVVLMRGLPYACKEEDIVNFFDGLRILDLHVEHDFTGRATGCAFVEFGTPEDYRVALSMNRRTIGHRYVDLVVSSKEMMLASKNTNPSMSNQSLIANDRDRPAIVKELLPLPQQEGRPAFCVALQGLPLHVSDGDISDFFGDVGVPLAMHIMLSPDGIPNGEAFVEFGNAQHFEMALNKSGKFIGPNMIKVLSIAYKDMMDVLNKTVGKSEPLLNRPSLNDARGKGHLDDPEMVSRSMMNSNRSRPGGLREMEETNGSRLGMNDSRSFSGPMRDVIQPRGFTSDIQDSMPLRSGYSDDPNFRGLRDGPQSGRNFLGEGRNFVGRPFAEGSERPRTFMGDSNDMKPRGMMGDNLDPKPRMFMGEERNPRIGGRLSEHDGYDDMGRNRRSDPNRVNSPDSRGHGPMDRSDLKGGGRHILDMPPNRNMDDMPGHDGRMHRGPGGGPADRRRMMPGGGPPEGFNKPGCVVGASNIPYRASIEEILAFFKDFAVTKENVLRRFNNYGQVTGDARVAFATPEDAQKAVAELSGKSINGRTISLFVT